ncbi:MAG: ParB N-terminal domain-containing protein, partial [Nitrospina sp.]|nr:ParB N-terminal domain-containing protein [Nitrospina sp.]
MKNKKIDIKKPQRIEVEVDKIDYDEDMPRNPKYAAWEKLIESIKRQGVQVAIAVEKRGDRWHLIYGFRRLMAAIKAREKVIPALDFSGIAPLGAKWLYALENLSRKELTPIEKGRLIIDLRRAANEEDGEEANRGNTEKEGEND